MKRMVLAVLAAVSVAAFAVPARADDTSTQNFLIGPLIGVRLGGPPGDRGVFGVEGGVGSGPERFNLGFEHRLNHELYYLEIDPWLLLGGSLGFGVESSGQAQGIIGLWEGVPLGGNALKSCPPGYSSLFTLSAGLRYSGVLELYATVKAGVSQSICF